MTAIRDLSAIEAKLAFHIGRPVVVAYGTTGPRMPAVGIITSPKVSASEDGLRFNIPMRSHEAFDTVSRRGRRIDGGIPIDSIVRLMPATMLTALIRVGEFEIRILLRAMQKTLAEGPGELVDIESSDKKGNRLIEQRRSDPKWQIAQQRSVSVFQSVLKAEIAMLTAFLRSSS